MEARIFTGRRTVEDAEVLADGQPLDLAPSLRLRRHSPTDFEWGYGGAVRPSSPWPCCWRPE